MDQISILSLNCCGIKRRLQYDEFRELITCHDILCFQETKTDDIDVLELENYEFVMKNRKKYGRVNSGGIVLAFRNYLKEHITIHETECKSVLWFELSKNVTNFDNNLIVGIIYIPPENSKYSSRELFTNIEMEMHELVKNGKHVILTGDFNARTGTELDIHEFIYDINDRFYEIFENSHFNIDLENFHRNNMDAMVNPYGKLLLDMCKTNNLFIMNGRIGDDIEGHLTCKQSSVVDYFICDFHFIENISNMEVLEPNVLYSDVHSPITLYLKQVKTLNQNVNLNSTEFDESIKCWDQSKENIYIDSIDNGEIQTIVDYLDGITGQVSNENINHIVDKLNNRYINAAKMSLGTTKVYKNGTLKTQNKPWFSYECKQARKQYRRSKNYFYRKRTEYARTKLKEKEKSYKKTLDKEIAIYRKQMGKKLKDMKSKNPKEYWNILNKNTKQVKRSNIDIKLLFDFFSELNKPPEVSEEAQNLLQNELENIEVTELNHKLNEKISQDEIKKCVNRLKNNKAMGDDQVKNEYIKSTIHLLLPLYEKLFNIIFSSGIVPNSWLEGNVKPIYKNKGSEKDPRNYRPITILSCVGKLFTAVLNDRLNSFSDQFKILHENQTGFRKKYSTLDNIFTIHLLFELLKLRKKKMFCAFIDFEKAFDTVWRNALWFKLLSNNINGNMYNIIVNMYNQIKSRISHNNEILDYFNCDDGVRQGENMSPFLFSIYLNDLHGFLLNANLEGLSTVSSMIEMKLGQYLKLFTLLYADDTVLMAESAEDLQTQLNSFNDYCKKWNLKVNVDKTKIIVFGSRNAGNLEFKYNDRVIDIVNEFNYLGIMFSSSGSFLKAKQKQLTKANKAIYEVLKKGRLHNLSIQCQLELFDRIIQPILLYGCEVWGFSNNAIVERVHLKFCKLLLHLKPPTPDFMIYGELGRYPMDIQIKTRMISYWSNLINGKQTKIAAMLYKLSAITNEKASGKFKWIEYIKNTLNNCGLSNIWHCQYQVNPEWLRQKIKLTLTDQFKHTVAYLGHV